MGSCPFLLDADLFAALYHHKTPQSAEWLRLHLKQQFSGGGAVFLDVEDLAPLLLASLCVLAPIAPETDKDSPLFTPPGLDAFLKASAAALEAYDIKFRAVMTNVSENGEDLDHENVHNFDHSWRSSEVLDHFLEKLEQREILGTAMGSTSAAGGAATGGAASSVAGAATTTASGGTKTNMHNKLIKRLAAEHVDSCGGADFLITAVCKLDSSGKPSHFDYLHPVVKDRVQVAKDPDESSGEVEVIGTSGPLMMGMLGGGAKRASTSGGKDNLNGGDSEDAKRRKFGE